MDHLSGLNSDGGSGFGGVERGSHGLALTAIALFKTNGQVWNWIRDGEVELGPLGFGWLRVGPPVQPCSLRIAGRGTSDSELLGGKVATNGEVLCLG